MILFAILITAILAVILGIAITDAYSFPRLHPQTPAQLQPIEPAVPAPFVSILIPARNEAETIGPTLQLLIAQKYPRLEVVVLDDNSEDGTCTVALCSAGNAPNFHLIHGEQLPAGWMGKNWACEQLGRVAQGDLLVFTDADVCWQPGAVAAVVAQMERGGADLLTVWPTQITLTWGERLIVPLMALAVLGYLPIRLVHDFPHPLAAAANGQCLAFRRTAYQMIGGHAAVRGSVIEDVGLAQQIKAAGLRLRMADGNQLLRCRMYEGWQATIDGYTKNILAGHGNRVSLLALSIVFHWALFVWPWVWLLTGRLGPANGWPMWPLALVATGLSTRAITAYATHQRLGDTLLLPISVLCLTGVALRAMVWRWHHGGVRWKGRIVKHG